jgi:hypothetical protein
MNSVVGFKRSALSSERERRGNKGVKRIKLTAQSTLARLAVDARPRRRYDKAVASFREFCILTSSVLVSLFFKAYQEASSFPVWDLNLLGHFELMASIDPEEPDLPPGLTVFRHCEATLLFLGLSDRYPELRGHLPRCHRALKAWGRQLNVDRAPPIPEFAVRALVGLALSRGFFSFAIGIALLFGALLRPSEFFALKCRALQWPKKFGTGAVQTELVLSLEDQTKTSVRAGGRVQEHAASDFAIPWLRTLLEHAPPDRLVYTASDKVFRTTFSELIDELGLGHCEFRLYSLRRGGASFLYRTTRNLDRVVERGRWAGARSAKVYIRDALSVSLESQCHNAITARFEQLCPF